MKCKNAPVACKRHLGQEEIAKAGFLCRSEKNLFDPEEILFHSREVFRRSGSLRRIQELLRIKTAVGELFTDFNAKRTTLWQFVKNSKFKK